MFTLIAQIDWMGWASTIGTFIAGGGLAALVNIWWGIRKDKKQAKMDDFQQIQKGWAELRQQTLERLDKAEQIVEALRGKLDEYEKEIYGLRLQLKEYELRVAIHEGKIKDYEAKIKEYEIEIAALKQKMGH